jgi:hypothetical protein
MQGYEMNELERVSFKTPVTPLPSRHPHVDRGGTPHPRFWTSPERQVLIDHYPVEGPAYCLSLLPNKALSAIYGTAKKLGLKAPKSPAKRENWNGRIDTWDEKIKAAWPELKGRGAVAELAQKLGVPRWIVSKRAAALGLSVPHKKEPAWTAPELALLAKVPLHSPDLAAREFRKHGFPRTATSIIIKAKRIGLSRRYTETLSATQIARILGVDGKTVTRMILLGTMPAEKRETQRLPQQGGDPWSTTRPQLRQWILDNLETIDIRKVDKFAFVEILVGQPDPGNGGA